MNNLNSTKRRAFGGTEELKKVFQQSKRSFQSKSSTPKGVEMTARIFPSKGKAKQKLEAHINFNQIEETNKVNNTNHIIKRIAGNLRKKNLSISRQKNISIEKESFNSIRLNSTQYEEPMPIDYCKIEANEYAQNDKPSICKITVDDLSKARDSLKDKGVTNISVQAGFVKAVLNSQSSQNFHTLNMTKRALSHTLGNPNLRDFVKPPLETCKYEWLATLLYSCLEDIQLVMSCIWDNCNCDIMSAGSIVYFLKHEENLLNLSARSYIEKSILWISEKISGCEIFDIKGHDSDFTKFKEVAENCSILIFRIYAHVYRHHLRHLENFDAVAHLNSCFKHFLYLSNEFNLIETREMLPLKNLCDAYLSDEFSLKSTSENHITQDQQDDNLNPNELNFKWLRAAIQSQMDEEINENNPTPQCESTNKLIQNSSQTCKTRVILGEPKGHKQESFLTLPGSKSIPQEIISTTEALLNCLENKTKNI